MQERKSGAYSLTFEARSVQRGAVRSTVGTPWDDLKSGRGGQSWPESSARPATAINRALQRGTEAPK
jgi:hypothetical protein